MDVPSAALQPTIVTPILSEPVADKKVTALKEESVHAQVVHIPDVVDVGPKKTEKAQEAKKEKVKKDDVKQSPVIIEKLDSAPEEPKVADSSPHSVPLIDKPSVVNIEKQETLAVAPVPQQVLIDTEPMVHFTPYDTVFDETKAGVSEIQYNPKLSVEEKPPSTWGLDDDVPKITIQGASNELTGMDIEDLDATDIDTSLGTTSDFEVLS